MNPYELLETPCFILNEQDVIDNITAFRTALSARFKHPIIGYSLKTNSLPYLLRIVKEEGCYAEVVSYHEYELALRIGFKSDHLIYNGPMKSKATFLKAIRDGAYVHIETWREIEWLRELPNDRNYKVGIRININISSVSPADEAHSNDDSRFGFAFESGELGQAISKIALLPNVSIVGVHSHREPKTRSVDFYCNIAKYIQRIVEWFHLSLEYWDLGGGFFGMMPNKPTYRDYVEAFYRVLSPGMHQITYIVEPGNAVVASAFDYVCQVMDVKCHDHQIYVTTDGTRNDIDPFFHKSSYFTEFVYKDDVTTVATKQQVIGGLTCLEYDRLFTLPPDSRSLQVGDRIVFHRVGAYTMALTPLFIHYYALVYRQLTPGKFVTIRQEWSEQEYIQKSLY